MAFRELDHAHASRSLEASEAASAMTQPAASEAGRLFGAMKRRDGWRAHCRFNFRAPRLIAGGAVHDGRGISMFSGARGCSQSKPHAPTITRYNQTLLPFLPTRPTYAVTLFFSRSLALTPVALWPPASILFVFSLPRAHRYPTGFLQYIPWLRIFHKRTYRRIPILPHPATFSVTCTTTLPLRLLEINTPTRSGDEGCHYCLRRQSRLHCVCRHPCVTQFNPVAQSA